MKDWYQTLKLEYKVAVWSLIVLSGLIILMIPLFFFKLMEVPQGIALGGGIGVITYLLLGIFNNKDRQMKSMVITVIVIVVRILIMGGILFLVGWLYYAKGFKAFNIFAVAGGYVITVIIYLILARKEKDIGDSKELS